MSVIRIFIFIVFAASVTESPILGTPIDKKLVVIGSSVPRGFGAYTAGSFLGQDVDGNGSPDSFASRGYAGLIKSYVESQGWTFDNQSTGGDDTADLLARFDTDLVPENPEVVLIALSMGNEGLTFTNDPDSVFESFRDGLQQIIQQCRDEGYYPVVGLVYPNALFTLRKYEYVKRMNLLINTWDVPSINLLGAIDDGTGRWAEGFVFDNSHPNVPGHEEIYHSVVPSLFDAIDQGKTSVPAYPTANGFLRLTQDLAQPAPLTYTPEQTMRAFTSNFRVRSLDTGTVAAVRIATELLFLVDFGPSDDANGRATTGEDVFGNYWNSWRPFAGGATIPTGTTLSDLITVENIPTNVSLQVTDTFSGSNGRLSGGLDGSDGPNSDLLGTLAVETVTEDYFFESATGAFKITGLDSAKRYTLRFFGTRQSGDDRETRFTVSGAMSYSPFAFLTTSGTDIGSNRSYDGNDDAIVMISGVVPTAGGEITVTVSPENGGFAYLGAMEVLVDNAGASDRFATVEVRGTELTYVAPDGREITAALNADDGSWHEVALSHRYAQQETLLYVDGTLAGHLRETLEPDQFILGGSGVSGIDAPANVDFQDWSVIRAAWTEDEAMAQHQGLLQQASLEICVALDDGVFSNGVAVANRAQSLSNAVINTDNATAPAAINPPGFLTALSTAADVVELSWSDDSDSETGFLLERRAFAEEATWTTIAAITANTTRYIDSGLTKSMAYTYRLSTLKDGLQSDYSNKVTISVGEGGRSYRSWISDYYDLEPTTYLIDFNTSTSPDYGSEIWNTVSSLEAGVVYSLVDDNNDGSAGYTIRLTSGFDQFRSSNGDPLVDFDDDPQRTLFVTNANELGEATIVLSGLDPELHYDLTLFARRGTVVSGFDYKGRYTITGGEGDVSYELDNALSNNLAEVLSIRPDSGGSITIQIDPTDVSAGTFFAGISFITLKEVHRSYLIDFNSATAPSYTSGNTWNTVSSVSSNSTYNLIDTSGASDDGYTLNLTSPFSTSREGDGPPTEGGLVDVTAQSNLFALTGNMPTPAQVVIDGLDQSRSYEVAFLAKRNSNAGGIDYSGIYTVTGAGAPVSLTIDAADNSEFGIVSAVVPNESGEITLEIAPNGDAATATNDFPVLNLMRIAMNGAASGSLPEVGPSQDNEGDGLLNYLEYALGRNPALDDASKPIQFETFSLEPVANNIVFSYARAREAQGVGFAIEYTSDMVNPNWQPLTSFTESVTGTSELIETIEVHTPFSDESGFFRLNIRYSD